MLFNYAYKFRLYPNREQKVLLEKHFGVTRYIWNYFLNKRQEDYLKNKETVEEKRIKHYASYYNDAKYLTQLKKETEWLKEVNSQSLQSTLKYLELAYSKFFKKLSGFPKFKKKRNKQSFTIPQFLSIENGKVIFPKFRDGIKVKLHREIEGRIVVSTLSKNPSGDYYISIVTEKEIEPLSANDNQIGIDVGIKDFAVCSTGEKFDNPKHLIKRERKLKKLQKKLSSRKIGSKNRIKRRIQLAKQHNKVANSRKELHHKISHKITSENQAIVIEDIQVKNLMQNQRLAKHIADAGWSEFLRQLEYKSKWRGRNLIKIDRFYPSSKTCNNCNYIFEGLTLKMRSWTCPECKSELDRDYNASLNILKQGLLKFYSAVGTTVDSLRSCSVGSS